MNVVKHLTEHEVLGLDEHIRKIARQVRGGGTSGGSSGSITIQEIDGSPSGTVSTLKVTNGTLTNDGGGTFTLTIGSGNPGGADTQVQFNDAGTFAGDAGLTYNKTTNILTISDGIIIGSSNPFSDAAGTLTLQNVDALDATTETTIEAAIDTLANLTSIQGRTVTLADAGANAIFGWDDVAGAYENLTQGEARTVLGLGSAAYVATDLADLNEATIETAIDTLANLTSATSLSAVGTITTGVWNGTDIAVADGGTGASTATAGFDNLAPTTTKGDVIVHNGTDNIRVAVGTNDQVLTADSTQASGVKWAAGGSSTAVTKAITQTSHGFAVGDIIRLSAASTYTKAQADTAANAEVVGIVSTVTDVNNFTVTTEGYITGLTVTAKEIYFLSDATAGLLTSTAPTTIGSISKPVLDTDTTTSGYVQIQRGSVIPATTVSSTNEFRLSLTNNSAYPTADVTAAGTLYLTPIGNVAGITNATGNIALYDGTSVWTVLNSATVSLALTLTDAKPYDVFVYNNSGTPALEVLVWTDGVTRATALVAQNGILVKSGATTRRYVGTLYASATNQTEDSVLKRYLWNAYHRVLRPMSVIESTDSWTYTTATWRQARASTANQLSYVCGLAEDPITVQVNGLALNTTNTIYLAVGIGIDVTDANSSPTFGSEVTGGGMRNTCHAFYAGTPGIGYHYAAWLEISYVGGTTTWSGDTGVIYEQTGMTAQVKA